MVTLQRMYFLRQTDDWYEKYLVKCCSMFFIINYVPSWSLWTNLSNKQHPDLIYHPPNICNNSSIQRAAIQPSFPNLPLSLLPSFRASFVERSIFYSTLFWVIALAHRNHRILLQRCVSVGFSWPFSCHFSQSIDVLFMLRGCYVAVFCISKIRSHFLNAITAILRMLWFWDFGAKLKCIEVERASVWSEQLQITVPVVNHN